jgi:hypothetical protein
MQIQFDDIGGSERLLRQTREEEFVDDTCARDPNRTFLFARRMGGHHHAAQDTLGSYRYLRTIVEAAHHLAFRTLLELIGRQVQARLNQRMIEDGVLFAASHKREANQVGEHGPSAILAVEPQQGALFRELVRREIATNGREGLAQFHSVEPVAPVAKRAEPTFSCELD